MQPFGLLVVLQPRQGALAPVQLVLEEQSGLDPVYSMPNLYLEHWLLSNSVMCISYLCHGIYYY